MHREDTGSSRASRSSSATLGEQRTVDQRRAGAASRAGSRPARGRALRRVAGAEAVLERDERVDHRVADEVDPRRRRCPRAAGSRSPPRECTNRGRRTGRRRSRLISSGIVRSKLRRPDSTCASGMPSLTATSAAASVELTSPGTITRSGRSARAPARAAPSPAPSARRGCRSRHRACESGSGTPSSSRKTCDISRS